ncbi:MAG: hypothetical protein COW48_01280 [Hydrogenophilales bacterium CG17_big_fil_post_rev_8_21_14_2_50_63_12]|nr:MAG: hypothetical protein COW48_01280 [Hydrogenophilales bacterium CG17_big_fil_post_rev_8_21_14_2_50_63_12]PIX97041.1 MAG: hypothetical protein COZ24_07365 [Hydrogenophilales bacterium CG_4_10_14_3_um_filter_63_21]PJB02345.1 MAG: hypothetical protein CO126_12345 [Hydrogenophilales bacterium CG_4_9_14_3_um_filter_63_34]
MDNLLKLGFAYWLAPSLVGGVAVVLAVAFGLTFSAAIIGVALAAAVLLAAALVRPMAVLGWRCLKNRLSPVRRRHPRPTAWHQWR